MKKLIFGACTALLLIGASCSKGGDTQNSPISKGLSDSVSSYFGYTTGGYLNNDFKRFSPEHQNEATKKEIVKGIQLAFANANTEGAVIGMQVGGQVLNQLKSLEEQGVKVDRNLVMKEITRQFLADTLDMDKLQEASGMLNALMSSVEKIKAEAEQAAKGEDPEAAAANAEGAAYIDQVKAADPEVQTSESGLSYKIENAGAEPKITDESMVVLNYVGKLTNGEVFDQSAEGQPATFSPKSVIPGFGEGLKLLGKGGKATFYIPGNLAYGPQGIPQAGIGPNATLVFEVEIVDVK